ncbi:Casparian strip membrane protein [Dioscorea alata]|uniref:Casparian strip membrane protein n=1 Tax=Dioscorea alata TaxID=55571 RepID=A0ACB7UCE3_DIOAL|nr:Casparian strip membrane protein [Dioscorea alata]
MSMSMAKNTRACCLLLLRLLALAATLTAAIVMATSHETTTFFNIKLEAKFQYTPAFVFFLIVNAVAGVYTLLVLFIPRFNNSVSSFIILMDLVVTMFLVSAISAAGAVSQVGKKGNEHAGWLPICGQTPEFCDHVMGALISAFVGVLIYFVLLLHTVYSNIFSPLLT